MRLLVTRAAADAAETRVALEADGHSVLVSPVIRIEALPYAWPQALPDAVLATSAHAFAAPAPAGAAQALPLYLVGQHTAASARSAGFDGPVIPAATSIALAARLRDAPAMDLVYLAGWDRKPDIEAALAGGAHRLSVRPAYRARAAGHLDEAAAAALRAGDLDGVLHYSRRSAALFGQLCAAQGLDASGLVHFCLSADVAAAVPAGSSVRVAPAPRGRAMLALVGPA